MEIIDQFVRPVCLLLKDGSRSSVNIVVEETIEESKTSYQVTMTWEGRVFVGSSKIGFFRALQKMRVELEHRGILLDCFGASENVYPSPMQESMGPALKAYRTQPGKQALLQDIVDIFDTDGSVKSSTVEEQNLFHETWLRSLQPIEARSTGEA